MRIDVLDLGSNTFHLLQAEVAGTHVEPVCDRKLWVRLGEDAFELGRIPDEACARALDAVAALLAPLGGVRPVAVATGVFREAANADGERGRLEVMESLPLGALRLAGLSTGEIRSLVVGIAGPVVAAIVASKPDEVILAAGTARALYKLARRLRRTSSVAGCMSRSTVRVLAELLHGLTPAELAQLGITSARHDTIAIGARVLATVVELLDVPVVRVASGALHEGVALHEAALRLRLVA